MFVIKTSYGLGIYIYIWSLVYACFALNLSFNLVRIPKKYYRLNNFRLKWFVLILMKSTSRREKKKHWFKHHKHQIMEWSKHMRNGNRHIFAIWKNGLKNMLYFFRLFYSFIVHFFLYFFSFTFGCSKRGEKNFLQVNSKTISASIYLLITFYFASNFHLNNNKAKRKKKKKNEAARRNERKNVTKHTANKKNKFASFCI